jgi:HlyD family secretion protein
MVEAFPTRNFSGKVLQIRNSPSTNQNVVSYDAVITVENRDQKLKPGMTATVSIITAQHEDVLKIPNAALRFKPEPPKGSNAPPAMARTDADQPRVPGSGGWGGGGRGGGGRGGGGDRPDGSPGRPSGARAGRAGRPPTGTRTIYLLDTSNPDDPDAKPVQIRAGISDGVSTEILDGLKEGDIVITGSNTPQATPTPGTPNPFGGGGMRRF